MYAITRPAGRLLLIRFTGNLTMEEGQRAIADIRGQFATAAGKLVLCGDLRTLGVLPGPLTDMYVAMFKQDNSQLERSGMLVGNAIVSLQIERMIKEANNPARKTFRDAAQLEAYLAPVLTQAERDALATFVR